MQHSPNWSDVQVVELVREHERLVRAYLRSLGCPAQRVDDLAQETFLRLFTQPGVPRAGAPLRGYLCSTARNLFLNSLRADAAAPDLDQVARAWSEYEAAGAGSTYLDALQGCLGELSERAREALRLRYGSEASRAAIAERLRLSLGGVKSLILRSKESLRACIERKLGLAPVDPAEAAQ